MNLYIEMNGVNSDVSEYVKKEKLESSVTGQGADTRGNKVSRLHH